MLIRKSIRALLFVHRIVCLFIIIYLLINYYWLSILFPSASRYHNHWWRCSSSVPTSNRGIYTNRRWQIRLRTSSAATNDGASVVSPLVTGVLVLNRRWWIRLRTGSVTIHDGASAVFPLTMGLLVLNIYIPPLYSWTMHRFEVEWFQIFVTCCFAKFYRKLLFLHCCIVLS